MHPLCNDNKSKLELKPGHLCYNYELESMGLIGEIGMHQETTEVLYQLLSQACQERDEAKEQLKKSIAEISELKKVLNKLLPSSSSAETSSVISNIQPDGRNRDTLKRNLDAKGSDNIDNSSADSLAADGIARTTFNAASLTDSGSLALSKKPFVQASAGGIRMGKFSSKDLASKPASKVIDNLIKGKRMPEKGRLLEAVLDTAPLLETLLITGQLPNWRNPPPLPPNLIDNNEYNLLNQIQRRPFINSESATPSSQALNYKNSSNNISFKSMEHVGSPKRFQ